MPQIKLKLRVFFYIIIFLLSGFLFLKPVKEVRAEKCTANNWTDDCNSLRPFPGMLWWAKTTAPTASMCGNSIFIIDPITVSVNAASILGSGNYTRTFNVHRSFTVVVDLSQAELPIMGNTEDVINRITSRDTLNDKEKVNDYVSWYLNGVNERAEYPFLAADSLEGQLKITSLSGPTKKLLPQEVQNNIRDKVISLADKDNVPKEKELPNQKVACTTILWGIPVPCYEPAIIKPNDLRLKDWNQKTPPKRENYKVFFDYYVAYLRWRGQSCGYFTIPIINFKILLCFDNPLSPNFWSNLFPYIPFSSTEDRKGTITLGYGGATNDEVKVINPTFDGTKPKSSTGFFAHMMETDTIAGYLKTTFVPKGVDSSLGNDIIPPTIEYGCKILETRNNPGDNLFAKKPKIDQTFSYNAEFQCTFSVDEVRQAAARGGSVECTKKPMFIFPINTDTPLADSVWDKLVAGTSSVFRRFFPKTGSNSPVYGIHDIPGSTKISYESSATLVSSTGDLYFPHIGGISEYFLKGIQTALRPKGMGEQVLSGQPNPDYTTDINCNKSAPSHSLPHTLGIDLIYDIAQRWVPGGGNHVKECYNDVVTRALAKGINPAFALMIWLNESDASNYNYSVQDFGINDSSVYRDFDKQITRFLELPTHSKYADCMSQPGWATPMDGFLSVYRTGKCDQSDQRVYDYRDAIIPVFGWVAPGCSFPTSPTDMSCY